jgi:Holliday junction resolvase RusA-like endonuclease
MRIRVKPLSVNQLWKGKRFKTPTYKDYETEVFYKLPPLTIPEGRLRLNLTFGFSSSNSDISNHVKAFEDILQKKYGFNDNRFYRIVIEKHIVKKGEEFIDFNIQPYD